MAALASPKYPASPGTVIPITLASLASDTTLLIGRQSSIVDNTSIDAIDCHVGGRFTLGSAPTNARQIEVWCFSSWDGTRFSASAGAADAALTLTAVRKALMKLVTVIPTDAAASGVYDWGPFSIAELHGGILPLKWGLWVVHNTGQALNATGTNHEMKYTPINFESA